MYRIHKEGRLESSLNRYTMLLNVSGQIFPNTWWGNGELMPEYHNVLSISQQSLFKKDHLNPI